MRRGSGSPAAGRWRNTGDGNVSLTHCYGAVGVGRDLEPDTGMGGELYAVIGQAPRQLDRNIALVGRVVEGIELMAALPRGTEALGFYKEGTVARMIAQVRLATAMPAAERPSFKSMNTPARPSRLPPGAGQPQGRFLQGGGGRGRPMQCAGARSQDTGALRPRVSRPLPTGVAKSYWAEIREEESVVRPPRRVLGCGCDAG